MKRLVCLFFVVSTNALIIEWPFSNDGTGYESTKVEASIGIPAQTITLNLTFYNYCPGLSVYSNKKHRDGFDPTASTTFKNTGSDENGIIGTDNVAIFDSKLTGQNFPGTPFSVIDNGVCENRSIVSLTHADDIWPNDFIDHILDTFDDKVAVITYDKSDNVVSEEFYGKLFFGGRPDFCDDNWNTFPEYDTALGPQWTFMLDKFEIGKFAASQPGVARFNIDESIFELSPETYDHVANELGVNDYLVPCDAAKNIEFTINGYTLSMTPDEYMDKSASSGNDCFFLGFRGDDDHSFTLPNSVLRNRCLLLDFKNKQIGVADRKK